MFNPVLLNCFRHVVEMQKEGFVPGGPQGPTPPMPPGGGGGGAGGGMMGGMMGGGGGGMQPPGGGGMMPPGGGGGAPPGMDPSGGAPPPPPGGGGGGGAPPPAMTPPPPDPAAGGGSMDPATLKTVIQQTLMEMGVEPKGGQNAAKATVKKITPEEQQQLAYRLDKLLTNLYHLNELPLPHDLPPNPYDNPFGLASQQAGQQGQPGAADPNAMAAAAGPYQPAPPMQPGQGKQASLQEIFQRQEGSLADRAAAMSLFRSA